MESVRTALLILMMTLFVLPGQAWASLYKEIQSSIICPACLDEGMTVAACTDSTAEQIRQDIERQLAAGVNKEQIIAGYVAQYGEIILTVPPKRGFYLLAWVMPVVATIGGTALVYFALNKWTTNHAGREPVLDTTGPDLDEADQERLRAEIRKYL